ncbi:predicted protein [Chaetoceros tenuissimus]|uniref:Uncharacterized protein n=1 Tax=Chaetoceros tenuissimus TaxID=426638 RepID=A0AAD3CH24_9STRA|nr:predicted protein [Chaetoceros tenuissimus]
MGFIKSWRKRKEKKNKSCNATDVQNQKINLLNDPNLVVLVQEDGSAFTTPGKGLNEEKVYNLKLTGSSCSNSTVAITPPESPASDEKSVRSSLTPSNSVGKTVQFAAKDTVITVPSEPSTCDSPNGRHDIHEHFNNGILYDYDDESVFTYDDSTVATNKTNSSDSSMQYLWKYLTCSAMTTSIFDRREQCLDDDLTIDSDLMTEMSNLTDKTGNLSTTLGNDLEKSLQSDGSLFPKRIS